MVAVKALMWFLLRSLRDQASLGAVIWAPLDEFGGSAQCSCRVNFNVAEQEERMSRLDWKIEM